LTNRDYSADLKGSSNLVSARYEVVAIFTPEIHNEELYYMDVN